MKIGYWVCGILTIASGTVLLSSCPVPKRSCLLIAAYVVATNRGEEHQ